MQQSPLVDFHKAHGARLVDFAGWEMPIMYTGIKEEHLYTRDHCSLFDVSHMGRLFFTGEKAAEFLDHICTRHIGNMKVGQSRYSHVCKEDGGILDDVIVSKMDDKFMMVCNGANRDKIVNWCNKHRVDFGVEMVDNTLETAMAALQGPDAMELIGQILPIDVSDLKRYHFKSGNVMGAEYIIARSGYTGEDGVEVILPANFGLMAANLIIEKSAELGKPIKPAGLGARDTLRLEAGMPLYGHELTEDWDPITSGQKWCCFLEKEFIGSEVVRDKVENGPERTVACIEIDGKRIAREGAKILQNGEEIGFVTSGTHSPTFDKVIAMGLIKASATEPGTALEVDLRGKTTTAKVVPTPFYKRGK